MPFVTISQPGGSIFITLDHLEHDVKIGQIMAENRVLGWLLSCFKVKNENK